MRQLNDWLSAYLKYTDVCESPADFQFWCALTVLSGVIRRKIKIDMGFYQLYPNLYVLLVAESALCRKSAAIDIAVMFFNAIEPPMDIYAESATAAVLLKDMSEYGGTVVICPREMVILLNDIYKTGLHGALTRLYDCPDNITISTIRRGKETIYNSYPVVLGATTPSDVANIVPDKKASGGLMSRFIIVQRDEPRLINSRPYKTFSTLELERKLIIDLNHIARLEGVFEFSNESGKWYDTWYRDHWAAVKESNVKGAIVQGYFARKHDLMLKIAMLIQISRSDNFTLEIKSMEDAVAMLRANEEQHIDALCLTNSSDTGLGNKELKDIIRRKGQITRVQLMQCVSHKWSAKELDDIITTLREENVIKEEIDNSRIFGRKGRSYKWIGTEEIKS